jgi:hypothetical protein
MEGSKPTTSKSRTSRMPAVSAEFILAKREPYETIVRSCLRIVFMAERCSVDATRRQVRNVCNL